MEEVEEVDEASEMRRRRRRRRDGVKCKGSEIGVRHATAPPSHSRQGPSPAPYH